MSVDRRRLFELTAVNRAILAAEDDEQVLALLADKTLGFVDADAAAVLTAGPDGLVRVAASAGLDAAAARELVAPLDERIGDAVRATFELGADDVIVAAPLVGSRAVLGLLVACRRAPRNVAREDDEILLSALADQAAIALEQARERRRRATAEEALQKRADELAAADHRKNEFLSMLAHELRNPLAPVLLAAKLLQWGTGPQKAAHALEVIVRQVRHMARLLDDLLDVSRIVNGKIELRARPIRLADVIDQAVELCGPLVDARRHRLSVLLPEDDTWILADADRVVQILGNLLNNAAKYTEPGGCIKLSAEREDGEAVLRVEDDGAGIPADLLPNVFDLFTQGPRSPDRAQGGLGIGLTMVQKLADLHGGSVRVRSGGPGLGSEFTVRLPATDATETASPSAPASPAASGCALHVLVVEDNADAAELLAEVVTQRGHTVEIAGDGASALAAAARRRPDVVLLDIGLPGMDGYEVAERLRAQLAGSPPVLVALTGYGQDADKKRAAEAGFHHHLVKPVGVDEIERILAEAR